jgi:uncharacterized protein (TIGR00255 family)
MSTKSMTGFARSDGTHETMSWYWEVRSVNGRGLDVRLRLPPGQEHLDQPVRKAVAGTVTRGNVNVQLVVQRSAGDVEIRLNEPALEQVLAAAERVRRLCDGPPVSVDAMLQIKGVLEIAEPEMDESEKEAWQAALVRSLDEALKDMVASRAAEGRKLAVAIAGLLDQIEVLVAEIDRSPARTPSAISERITEQLARIAVETVDLDPTRLHQEAVLLAAKADIEEELQRLRAHVEAARGYLALSEPVGRKLDFLTQEFNREANTICSKSNDIGVTRTGLALKAAIEQMREQVQNIE